MARSGFVKDPLGHETDDLAPCNAHPSCSRFHLHHVVHARQWRLLGVDEIHRYLGLSIDFEAKTLHVPEAAAEPAHGLRHFLRDRKVCLVAEVDVVGDEEWTSANGSGTRGRMDLVR